MDKRTQMEIFCQEVVKGKTYTEAYITSHPHSTANATSLKKIASRYWNNPETQEIYKDCYKRMMEITRREAAMTMIDVVDELSKTAMASMDDVIVISEDEEGKTTVRVKEDADLSQVQELYVDAQGNARVRLYDKIRAMQTIANITNMKEKDAQENNLQQEVNVVFNDDIGKYAV